MQDSNIIDDVKKFLGIPPYNITTNIVCQDGHYLQSLYTKYDKNSVDSLVSLLKGHVSG